MSGRKRLAVIFAVMLIVSVALTMNVFAAGEDDTGFFSLWDLLSGIGGMFRDLINYIGQFIANIISAIKNGVNALIGAVQKVIAAIGSAVNYLLNALKYLFIPSKEFLSNFRDDILAKFDKKFGSVFSALNYLKERFKGLSAKKDLRDIFKVSYPPGTFMYGISIDFLAYASPVLEFFRFCVTGFLCYWTAMTCYNKVIGMVNK